MLCPVWAYIKHENHSKLINPNIYIYIYMVFTTEGLLEVAIESWPEWDLNPRPLIYIYIYIYIYTLSTGDNIRFTCTCTFYDLNMQYKIIYKASFQMYYKV